MDYEENLRSVNEAVDEAIGLINEKHPGANLDEAFKHLNRAAECLEADSFGEAVEFAEKSGLAARPNTEYLLSKARHGAASANNLFDSGDHEGAINSWKSCLDEYGRARELASQRNEQVVLEQLTVVEETINGNIKNAEIAIDNNKLVRIVKEGNAAFSKANGSFESKDFDDSLKSYKKAKQVYSEALKIAEKRNFAQDMEKIKKAMESAEKSIHATLLNKGQALVETAAGEKDNSHSRSLFGSAIKYLEGLDLTGPEVDELLLTAREGLLRVRIEEAKEQMKKADELFNTSKFYESKEAYSGARSYIDDIINEASVHKLSRIIEELESLSNICTTNMSAAVKSMVSVGEVKHEITLIEDFVTGMATYSNSTPRPPVHNSAFPDCLLGSYTDPSFIGKGGFARVFRVKRKDGRIVAVKVPIDLDQDTSRSFLAEMSSWRRLSHDNIITMNDMNIFPIPYLELEYADGGSLEDLKKPLCIDDAARVVFDISDALKHAHEDKLIHLDIKPQNILLTGNMVPKITDWGLSKVRKDSRIKSRSFSRGLGKNFTVLYAAPEQIDNTHFGRVDQRTDIYQLGLLFYELLTGVIPFEHEEYVAITHSIINERPPLPSGYNPECIELDNIVMKCLEKNMDDRYQDISSFRADLAAYLKLEYRKSLKVSSRNGNFSRSRIYCGQLILAYAMNNEVTEALAYAEDLKNYAESAYMDELKDIVTNLDYCVDRKQEIGHELMSKIRVVVHQIKMGR